MYVYKFHRLRSIKIKTKNNKKQFTLKMINDKTQTHTKEIDFVTFDLNGS